MRLVADVDAAWAASLPRGDGQRLEPRTTRASASAGPAGLVAAADTAETGVHRDTVRNYLLAAGIRMRRQRGRRLEADAPKPASQVTLDPRLKSKPASQVTPGSVVAPAVAEVPTSAAKSHCEVHRDLLAGAPDQGRNGKSMWQELVDRHGFTGSYQSVKRFVRKLQPSSAVAHPRITTAPARKVRRLRHGAVGEAPEDGQAPTNAAVRHDPRLQPETIWLLAWKSISKEWRELHEAAFRRLGGAPQTIVLDDLREGVVAADVNDPTLNPLYRDIARAHRHGGTAGASPPSGSPPPAA